MDTLTHRKSARWLLGAAQRRAEGIFNRAKSFVTRHYNDGATLEIRRGDKTEHRIRMGPNEVFAFVTHPDNSIDLCLPGANLLTNIGQAVIQTQYGAGQVAGNTLASNVSTAISSTSVTGTGSVWTASNLGTPTLGCAGARVFMNAHTTTGPTVWGNVVSNTNNVLTIDQWWKLPASSGGVPVAGTTPTSGDAFVVYGIFNPMQFMAITTNSSAASATDTTLASEITSNGCGRAMTTYTRGSYATGGSGTFTVSVVFSASGTETSVQKMGLFGCLTSAGADPMCFEGTFSAASLISGDTLTVTDTATYSG